MERRTPAGQRIRFPAYALRRFAQRGIEPDEVLQVIAASARLERSRHAIGRVVHRRTLRGRRLTVVTEPVEERGRSILVVVTAWRDGADA